MSGRSRTWYVVAALIAVVVVWNVALLLVRGLVGGGTHGRRSSSYATVPTGLAAYADLLRWDGHLIRRERRAPGAAGLSPATTAVVLDPTSISSRDVVALRRFVSNGGHLVAGGDHPSVWLRDLVTTSPRWSSDGKSVWRRVGRDGGRRVVAAGTGAWVGGAGSALLLVKRVGKGRVDLIADPSPLQNRYLDKADNAAFALDVAGPRRRPVVFLESLHGYARATGLAAVPRRWWWALACLGIAGIVFVVARGRRLGPPEEPERPLPPHRREYAEALGGVLARTRDRDAALEPVRTAVKAYLETRTPGHTAGEASLRDAAVAMQFPDDELRAIFEPVRTDEGVLAAGRALARVEGRTRR